MSMMRLLRSGIGTKILVAVTGLGLVGFLASHVAGNMNIFLPPRKGQPAIEAYADQLHHIPGFIFIELGLVAMFVGHIMLTLMLVLQNRQAKGSRYAVQATKQQRSGNLASRTMAISGIIVLVFLVVHVSDFRLQRELITNSGGLEANLLEKLAVPWRAALYVVGSILISFHMTHGIASAFRSFGLAHEKYTPIIEKAGYTLGIVIGLGFASIPIYALIKGGAS
ncbi:MAG: succinate dehydrogenase [Myxococcales bacterium]|nr:succinate dehydrogenase [Myxococcales bacterium]